MNAADSLTAPLLALSPGDWLQLFLYYLSLSLLAVGGAIAASWYFGLQTLGVSTVGVIPQGLPAVTLPDLSLIERLVPGALGIALMTGLLSGPCSGWRWPVPWPC